MSRSTSSRPSSSSRTAPPTTQDSWPSSTSPAVSSIDHRPPRAPWVGADPRHELVVDRPGHPGMVLGEHAMAEDRHRSADRLLLLELDGERVHRDRAYNPPRLPADANLGAGEIATEPVRIADGDDPDPRRPLRDEGAAVAGALAGLEALYLREVAAPRERGLEAVFGRVRTERREPVERDPAPRRVEARRRNPQRRRAVGRVPHQVAVRLGRLPEPLDLLLRERRVAVGSREVRHQADDLGRRLRQL